MTETALAFDEVSKRYRNGTLALSETSWSIPIGARACLLGPNGAGKSTSIRLLEGALNPTTGWVSLLGAEVGSAEYLAARRRTGIVPQLPGMYPDLRVREYFELVRRLYGRGDVSRIAATLELGPHMDKNMSALSGGFQRRVVLAAALLAEPELLLLDEPTVGLDPVAAREVRELLREVMRERTTLLCTHNLAEAEALCDDVVILRGGKVALHESLAALRLRATPRVRVGARQPPTEVAAALVRHRYDAVVEDGTVIVRALVRDDVPALLRSALGDGLHIVECTPLEPSLEELFLEAVRG